MPDFDNLASPTSAFIDSDNNIQDMQAFAESGAIIVTAVASPGPITPIGIATVPQFGNIQPWKGGFLNPSNEIIDLINFLTSGAIQVQVVGGGGGGAPSTGTYITQTDETIVLPNSVPLSNIVSGLLSSTTSTGVLQAVVLTGTSNQIVVTNGDGVAGDPTLSISPTLTLPGTLTLGGTMNTGDNIIESDNQLVLQGANSIECNSPWLSVVAIRQYGNPLNKILFTTNQMQFLPNNTLIMQLNAGGMQLGTAGSGASPVNNISKDGTFASPNNNSLATTQAISTFVLSQISSGLTFTPVTTATQSLSGSTLNYTTYAGLSVMTLPTTSIAGSIIRIVAGPSGNTFQIAQNSGQQIFFGAQNGSSLVTTMGIGGYLQSSDPNTFVELVCVVANTSWIVSFCQQNLIGV